MTATSTRAVSWRRCRRYATLPAWRIVLTAPADDLSPSTGKPKRPLVGWNYLAAINLIETRFGSIAGLSTAGAQGPMQFMPETWAAYGAGGG